MAYYKHFLWSAPAMLVAALTVAVGTGAPIVAHAAEQTQDQANEQKKIKVRKEEEVRVKKEDPSYNEQVMTLAKQYEATAKRVASQGGDPKPLLDAAAYFASQAQ